MRPGTTITLAAILVALFSAVFVQFVVLRPSGGPDCRGTVTAQGTTTFVLPVPDNGLAPLTGKRVAGCRVTVQSVTGAGFWVGADANRRVYVVPKAPGSFAAHQGDVVDVQGTLEPVDEPQLQGLSEADRRQLQQQAGYIAAEVITPAGRARAAAGA